MDGPIQEQYIAPNVENNQNKLLAFRFHKKLAIIILVGLIVIAFRVGAYYVGKQSTSNSNYNRPTPTPYQNPTPTLQVTIFPTNTTQESCSPPPDCVAPPKGCNYEPMYINGCLSSCGELKCQPTNQQTDYLTWPIKNTCFPGPKKPDWEIFKTLNDKTFIYRNIQTGEMFRGTENGCL